MGEEVRKAEIQEEDKGTSCLEAGNDTYTEVLGEGRRLFQDDLDHSRPGKVVSKHRMVGMVAWGEEKGPPGQQYRRS